MSVSYDSGLKGRLSVRFFPNRLNSGIGITVFAIVIVLILICRRPDLLLNSQFWAEDGTIFFADQLKLGSWESICTSYAGYLHTIPRLIAALCQFVPIRWTPLAFNLCALSAAAFSCTAFYWPCFRRLVSSDAVRAACCIAAVAAIPTGGELVISVCNLQTFLSVLALLLIYRNQDSTSGVDRRFGIELPLAILQVLIALTAPVMLLFAPFLAWQLIRNRGWRRFIPLLVMGALALQFFVSLRSHLPKPKMHFNTILLSTAVSGVSRAILCPVLGQNYLLNSERALFVKLLLGFGLSVALVTAMLVSAENWTRRRILLAAIYAGIGSVAFATAGRDLSGAFLNMSGLRHIHGERYFFLATCMFIFILAMAIDQWLPRIPVMAKLAMMFVLFFHGVKQNFQVAPFVDLSWPANAAKIESWRAARNRHESVGNLVIPINPPPFTMTLTPGT